jgi:chromosome segregation ATPase
MSNITLDEFATMVMKQFTYLEEKIDSKIDSKIDGLREEMSQRFTAVEQRLDRHEALLLTLISDVENIKDRLSSIEEFVTSANSGIKTNKEDVELALKELSIIKARVAKLETQLAH